MCWELLEPEAPADQWGHEERSVMAFEKFLSIVSHC